MTLTLVPQLYRAAHALGLLTEASVDGITSAESHILSKLAEGGELTVSALHQAFGHRRSTLTSILNRLADRGFITRDIADHDRRTVVVRVTRVGRAAARRSYEALRAFEDAVERMTQPAERAGFARILQAMEEAASEQLRAARPPARRPGRPTRSNGA